MRNLPINWHEGLFLRPQHFQAAERHWVELQATSERWDHPCNFGVKSIEFSKESVANYKFQLHQLSARLRDGTLIEIGSDQEPDRLDLKESLLGAKDAVVGLSAAFEKEAVVRVFLAVPRLKAGRRNLSRDGADEAARFVEANTMLQDENDGGNDQDVSLRALNVRLMLSNQDLSGYETIPIAQIRRSGEGEAAPQVDNEYIPPVISIEAWPGLGRDIVRACYDLIGRKVEVLSQQIVNRGVGLDSQHPGDLERILMLSELNRAHCVLSVFASAQGVVHPLTAYTEMCRVVGQLSLFGAGRRSGDLPAYDHENLGPIFRHVFNRIVELIYTVRDYEFEQRYFVGVGLGMQVTLDPKWFNSDWEWYIGVNKGELSRQECLDLLSPGQLDWKFGSSRQVEVLFKHRAEGLNLTPVERPIRSLPARPEWIYYEVPRNDKPAWRDVQETQTLALRLRDSLIMNLDRLQGERTIAVSARGKRAPLQFALFAVPRES
ncbi:MAG TPA: type VI secretion system baseplate subunit TssK [Planctomycetaceae bacterium]|nr:type VI secretion system baseplate subunit TssK [Planctomycetaceae bacterium]